MRHWVLQLIPTLGIQHFNKNRSLQVCNSISSPKTIMTMEHPPLKKMHVLLKKGIFQKVMLVFGMYLPFQSLTICLKRCGPSHPQQIPGRQLMVTGDHTRCILVKQFYEFKFIESSFCFLIFTSGLCCRRRFTWMICHITQLRLGMTSSASKRIRDLCDRCGNNVDLEMPSF